MSKLIKVMAVSLFFVLGLFSLGFCQEQITITTYYPSPYGSYNELRTYSNTHLATDSGNVGIGTMTPDAKLHVVGGHILTNPGFGFMSKDTEGQLAGVYTMTDDSLRLVTDATPRLTILEGGNVGIGTASPTSFNLEVNGGIMFNKGLVYGLDTYQRSGAFRRVRLTGSPYIEIQAGDGNLYGISIWLSSQKYKKNITNLEVNSNKIYELRPVSFNWKSDTANKNRTFGLIAEDVQRVLPELVIYNENNEPHIVNYDLLPVLNLNELKKLHEKERGTAKKLIELSTKVESLYKEIEMLKREIGQLRERGEGQT